MDHPGGPPPWRHPITTARLIQAYNTDLANGLGNLTNRTVTLLHRHYDGRLDLDDGPVIGPAWDSIDLDTACAALPSKIDAALQSADFRSATAQLVATVDLANQLLNAAEPWKVIRNPDGDPSLIQRLPQPSRPGLPHDRDRDHTFLPGWRHAPYEPARRQRPRPSPEPVFARLTYLE